MINLIIGTKPSTSKKNLPDESDFDEQSDIETEQTQKKKSTFSSFKLQIKIFYQKGPFKSMTKQSSDDSVGASERQILPSTIYVRR